MAKYVRIYPVDGKRHFRQSHTCPNGHTFNVDAGWTKVDDAFAAELALEVTKAEDPDSAKVFEIKDEETFEQDRNAQLHKLAMAQMAAISAKNVDAVGAVKDITTKNAAAADFVAKRKGRPPGKKDAPKEEESEDSDE